MPTKRPDSTDLTVYIRKDLKRDFKLLCAALEVSMSEVVGEFIEKWVEERKEQIPVQSEPETIAQIVRQNFWRLRENNIKNIDAIASGQPPTKADIVRISSVLNLNQGELLKLAQREFGTLPKPKS